MSRVFKVLLDRLRVEQPPLSLLHDETLHDETLQDETPRPVPDWEPFTGGLDKIPVGLKEREEVYGVPILRIKTDNTWGIDRRFARNLATVPSSEFACYHRRLYMHRKVAVHFIEALRRATVACPDWTPKRIGCFNPRRMRHSKNPRVPLSDHTWGIAFDIDSKTNRSWSKRKYPNRQSEPFAPGWGENSDIPEEVVLAFESCGFEWGGRWASVFHGGTFCDPMHFSLRKINKDR